MILYIHPHNHTFDVVIPAGAITTANAAGEALVGRYAHEVTAAELASASTVWLDVHWFSALGVLEESIAEIRAHNPRARIVVGGITAEIYGEHLRERFGVDAVPATDAERSVHAVPSPALPTGDRPLTEAEFQELDPLSMSWFPSYERRTREAHERVGRFLTEHPDADAESLHARMSDLPPFLLTTRGCPRNCTFCYGSYQRALLPPRRVMRPETLRGHLRRLEGEGFSFVNLFFGHRSGLPPHLEMLTANRFDLAAVVLVCGVVDIRELRTIDEAFARPVVFNLLPPESLDGNTEPESERFDRLLEEMKRDETLHSVVFAPDMALFARLSARFGSKHTVVVPANDWHMKRPIAVPSPDETRAQLERVTEHGRRIARARLALALAPTLGHVLSYYGRCSGLRSAQVALGGDAEERAFLADAWDELDGARQSGFGALSLVLVSARAPGPGRCAWLAPNEISTTTLSWRSTLRGFAWESEPDPVLPSGAWLGTAPRVAVRPERVHELPGFVRARFAMLRLREPSQPLQAVGGRLEGEKLTLWARYADGVDEVEAPPPWAKPTTS